MNRRTIPSHREMQACGPVATNRALRRSEPDSLPGKHFALQALPCSFVSMNVGPVHQKPASPGIEEGPENSVHILYRVEPETTFEQAASQTFDLVLRAQRDFPGYARVLYLEIEGHTGTQFGFDGDFFEFQQEYLQGFLGPFLSALDMPLLSVFNPRPQRNDLPDKVEIDGPATPTPGGFPFPLNQTNQTK